MSRGNAPPRTSPRSHDAHSSLDWLRWLAAFSAVHVKVKRSAASLIKAAILLQQTDNLVFFSFFLLLFSKSEFALSYRSSLCVRAVTRVRRYLRSLSFSPPNPEEPGRVPRRGNRTTGDTRGVNVPRHHRTTLATRSENNAATRPCSSFAPTPLRNRARQPPSSWNRTTPSRTGACGSARSGYSV